jgi:glycosyltransferase involved in cell wall biosynthesis
MKLLFISNLFPDERESYRGLDNATLLHHLSAHCEIRVIAARPALPATSKWRQQHVPRSQDAIFEPVYVKVPYLPKIGSRVNHRLFERALREPLQELRKTFAFDAILCAWAYPDACGVSALAREHQVPFTVITQGSDVHAYLENPVRRHLIVAALSQAKGVINRSRDLARRLKEAGVPEPKLRAVYNGVDTATFRPTDQTSLRRELGLNPTDKILLFIGNFLPVKNPLLLLGAFAELLAHVTGARLLLIGGGPMEEQIIAEAARLGITERVEILGRKGTADVARYLQASDVLVMSSHNEGVPNVILEALATGIPVVSTNVGGIHEVVNADHLGRLVPPGDSGALATALRDVLERKNSSAEIARYGQSFNWPKAAREYYAVIAGP